MRSFIGCIRILVVFFSVLTAGAGNFALAAPVLNSANNHYYEAVAVSGGLTWIQARDAAAGRSHNGLVGRLVSITSADENAFVVANCPAAITGNWWIGGNQDKSGSVTEPGGGWKWVGEGDISYFNWQTGEPNNNAGFNPPEDYLQILSNGKWNDNTGVKTLGGYIVEYEAALNSGPAGKIVFSSRSFLRNDTYVDSEIFVVGADGVGDVQLTDNSYSDEEPCFSWDGTKIAFSSDRDGNTEIYTMDAYGSNTTRLTFNDGVDGSPSFRRDGGKIVFSSNRDGNNEIYTMNPDGTSQTRITHTTEAEGRPCFSPDGSKIAFTVFVDTNLEIYVMNADGTNRVRLTDNAVDDKNPCWAPDGSKILFASHDGTGLFTVDSNGGPRIPVPSTKGHFSPTYSPDGRWIADLGLWLQREDGSQPTRLTDDGWYPSWVNGVVPVSSPPRLSIDDARIVEGNNGYPKSLVFTVSLQGGSARNVTVQYATRNYIAGANDFQPRTGSVTFSPGVNSQTLSVNTYQDTLFERDETFFVDLSAPENAVIGDGTGVGTIENDDPAPLPPLGKIAFMSSRDGNNEIYVMNADGSAPTNITNAPNNDRHPSWRADGKELIFSRGPASGNTGADIFTVNEDGSNPSNLTNDGPDDQEPSFGQAGQAYYSSFGGLDYDVFTVPLEGGGRTRRVNNSLGDYHPRLNPGGTKLVFYTFPDGQTADIYVANADGSGQTRLTSATGHDRYAEWSPDGNWIVFTSQRDGNSEIYLMYADGSNAQRLTFNSAEDEYPCFSPDGKYIAFASNRDGNYEIYLMTREGAGVQRLTQSTGADTFPTWAPGNAESALPRFTVSDATVGEGQNAVFNVSLSRASNQTISVQFATTNVTALEPADYTTASGSLTFAPGETSKVITIATAHDEVREVDETFLVSLSQPQNARLSDASGTGIISDPTRPDLLIKAGSENDEAYAINDEYQSTPTGAQIKTQSVLPGTAATYQIVLENDTLSPRRLTLRATLNAALGWTSAFKVGTTDITSQITGDGFQTELQQPGEKVIVSLSLLPSDAAGHRDDKHVVIKAFAESSNAVVIDAVEAVAKADNRKPVAVNDSGSTFEDTPLVVAAPGVLANDSDGDGDNISLEKIDDPSHGTVELSADGSFTYTPDKYFHGKDSFTYRVSDGTDISELATVTINVTRTTQPDLLVKKDEESVDEFAIDNEYQTEPVGEQIEASVLQSEQTATYQIKIQNDGNSAPTFVLRAQENDVTGYGLAYFAGETNITDQMKGAGYTTSTLAPGASQVISVSIASSTARGGLIKSTLIRAFNDADDTTVRDSVKIDVTTTSVRRPDLLIRGAANGQNLGNDVYNNDGANQSSVSTLEAGAAATYVVTVQNDGNLADTYELWAVAPTNGWTAKYFDAAQNGNDITGAVTGDGWDLALDARESREVRIELSSPVIAAGGAASGVLLQATSSGDASKQDAVRASAMVAVLRLVDGVIRNNGENAVLGDDTYNTNGNGQTREQTIKTGAAATYLIAVQNDGNVADSFKVKGDVPPAGWTAKYFDVAANAEISSQVLGAGWTTPALNAGASREIRLIVTPATTVAHNAAWLATATLTSQGDVSKLDVVGARTTAIHQPDLLIRKLTESDAAYALNDVYQSTPSGDQVEAHSVAPGVKATYSVRVQNDSGVTRNYLVKAQASAEAGWTVVYKVGSTVVTSQIIGAGRTTANLSPNASETITVEVTPNTAAERGVAKTVTINVFSDSADAAARDSVRAVTTAAPTTGRQPDIAVRADGGEYSGGNFINSDGTAQLSSLTVANNNAATYFLKVQNDGTLGADRFRLTVPAVGTGWTAKYFDVVTNAEITSQITSSTGWTTPSLNAEEAREIKAVITPGTAIGGGVVKSLLVTAASTADTTKKDAAKIDTSVTVINRVDALIKKSTEADALYALNNIYQQAPTGDQVERQTVNPGAKATYYVRVQNDGNATRNFLVKAKEDSQTGWTVAYKMGSTTITSQILGAGYTTSNIAAGSAVALTVEMTPTSGAVRGMEKTATLSVFLDGADSMVQDSVQAAATAATASGRQPDMQLRNSNDSLFIGDNIYNTDALSQDRAQSTSRNVKATYYFKVQNDGTLGDDRIKLTVPAIGTGWTAKYIDVASNTDITALISSSSGWTTPILSVGASREVAAEVTPGSALSIGTVKSLLVTAASVADVNKKDVIRAVTTVKAS